MIALNNSTLSFSFPDLHEDGHVDIGFQRTLRIPDDGKDYPLPAGFGNFPLLHVEDFAESLPNKYVDTGGVIMPMYQSEAMWIHFQTFNKYPCAIKIGTGKICAITGKEWNNELSGNQQDYVVSPEQPWLDGYRVDDDTVRQFIAMPLGQGYTVEEQITGDSQWGGLQIMVVPMKRSVFDIHFPPFDGLECFDEACMLQEIGLAPGGRIKQQIYKDPYGVDAWDLKHASRCFVHTVNSIEFKKITGLNPPETPISPASYSKSR